MLDTPQITQTVAQLTAIITNSFESRSSVNFLARSHQNRKSEI